MRQAVDQPHSGSVIMQSAVEFEAVGRLPHPRDNVAIAIRTLGAGTKIKLGNAQFPLNDTVLQGHRFAVRAINFGEALLSWGEPFGIALSAIAPGDYVCNEGVLRELRSRSLDFSLPAAPNFADQIPPFVFDEAQFTPSPPLPLYDEERTFLGYPRSNGRGVGTRNMVVLLGTSSLTGGFVRQLETTLQPLADQYTNIDGIVAVAHTEGGHSAPNNRELLLRTLAGFMVNPNVGAVLAVDQGHEAVSNADLRDYLVKHNYPIDDLPHQFMSLSRSFGDDLEAAGEIVRGWLETVNATSRSPQPISALNIGLQCGGSDAFSGVSGNPLAAWVTKEILRYGGSANLAETDELIGAEAYMLSNVRDLDTARKFLSTLERFKTWVGWHGHSAEGNPSGGNRYRGLYNIYLKSLGASAKRHPDVRLDYVIDYGEPMPEAGFYFMDSPGNDLESIAGQIASGCNMIFFVTGNGSITNFPFVPTLKIVTTTERFNLLSSEMDVNAGAYLDGTPMDVLGAETLQLTIDIASGQLSAGEVAGHAQVQIWRDWRQTSPIKFVDLESAQLSGKPLPINTEIEVPDLRFPAFRTTQGYAADQVGLILPTSLCSGQIALLCVQQLNESSLVLNKGLSRFVTLVHTEGCGAADGHELTDTLLGYLRHPMVKFALLLEHGCEKTHNSYIRQIMTEKLLDPRNYGWASIQLDGGIQKVVQKMHRWFADQLAAAPASEIADAGLEAVRIAIVTQSIALADDLAHHLSNLTRMIAAAGGSVIIADNDPLLRHPSFIREVLNGRSASATLGYAQIMTDAGLHVMSMPSQDWSETLTGLGASGVDLILAHVSDHPMPAHPLIPVVQVSANPNIEQVFTADLDGLLTEFSPAQWTEKLLNLIVDTLARRYTPRLIAAGNTQFQITRGLLGVSL
jgi:altronate dehydratase